MTTEPAPAADPLYALAPAEFVAARNALAKELKAAGDKEQAAVVAKLRRPTPVAYALNRVARTDAPTLERALGAGAALRAASDAAVGGDASTLRAATAADREALRDLTASVAAILEGSAADLSQKVTATVRAAAAAGVVADELRAGRLEAEHEATGFGGLDAGLGGSPAPRPPVDDLASRRQAKQATAEKVDKAARDAAKAKAQAAAEERRARTRREGEHRKRLAHLESKARRLAEVATEAEEAAVAARAAADAAEAELVATREAGPEGAT